MDSEENLKVLVKALSRLQDVHNLDDPINFKFPRYDLKFKISILYLFFLKTILKNVEHLIRAQTPTKNLE